MLNQRIPRQIHPTLEAYIRFVNHDLPHFINALYIVGSIALDEFNQRFSDIDFVAVLNHKASKRELERLRAIHKSIGKEFPRWKLSGEYFQRNDLGYSSELNPPYLRYHDGKLHIDEQSQSNLITYGISIFGTEPQYLDF
jgi:hypothetical protein